MINRTKVLSENLCVRVSPRRKICVLGKMFVGKMDIQKTSTLLIQTDYIYFLMQRICG